MNTITLSVDAAQTLLEAAWECCTDICTGDTPCWCSARDRRVAGEVCAASSWCLSMQASVTALRDQLEAIEESSPEFIAAMRAALADPPAFLLTENGPVPMAE